MSATEKLVFATTPVKAPPPAHEAQTENAPAPQKKPYWRELATPALVLLLAAGLVVTITRNWNAWEGSRIEQVTDDAYVRGDVTPLSTKVAGIVRDVKVSDFQQVHKGDLLVELQDNDYSAQVAQATAAVEAARAAIENNRRQRELRTHASSGLWLESIKRTPRSQRHKAARKRCAPMWCARKRSASDKKRSC